MGSYKSRIRAFILRGAFIGYYFRKYHVFPHRTNFVLGAVIGFAAGFYLDKGIRERSIVDNIAFGLAVAALVARRDSYAGISAVTPTSRKLGLGVLAFVAVAAAASRETKRGLPAKIPLLGTVAILLSIILLMSATSTVVVSETRVVNPVSTTSYSRVDGLVYARHLESSTGAEATAYYAPVNGTGYVTFTFPPYTRVDEGNVSHTSDSIKYIGIPIRFRGRSNFTRTPGVYKFKVVRIQNVSIPLIQIRAYAGGNQLAYRTVLKENTTKFGSSAIANRTVTQDICDVLNTADYVLVHVYRSENYPSVPLTISIHFGKIEEKRANTIYLLLSAISIIIAIIDAMPEEISAVASSVSRRRR